MTKIENRCRGITARRQRLVIGTASTGSKPGTTTVTFCTPSGGAWN
jgi:hypothetical protein